MTREEAINKLIRIRQVQGPKSEAHDALGMAIEALSQTSLPTGLEEELKRYINSEEYINTRESGYLLIARHFAEWGAEHLKK